MNRRALGVLITVNIVLLMALALATINPAPAEAQPVRGRGDYVMIAGQISARSQQSAVYILELKSYRMVAIMFNSGNRKLEVFRPYDMDQDLRGDTGGR